MKHSELSSTKFCTKSLPIDSRTILQSEKFYLETLLMITLKWYFLKIQKKKDEFMKIYGFLEWEKQLSFTL